MSNRTTHRRVATRQQLAELLDWGMSLEEATFHVRRSHRCRTRATGRR